MVSRRLGLILFPIVMNYVAKMHQKRMIVYSVLTLPISLPRYLKKGNGREIKARYMIKQMMKARLGIWIVSYSGIMVLFALL